MHDVFLFYPLSVLHSFSSLFTQLPISRRVSLCSCSCSRFPRVKEEFCFVFFSAPVACWEVMPEFLLVFPATLSDTAHSERFGKALAEAPGTLRCFTLYVVPQQSEKRKCLSPLLQPYSLLLFFPQHRNAVHANAVHVY